jgi:hypothetical protein
MRRPGRLRLALALLCSTMVLVIGLRPAAAIPDDPLEPKETTTTKAPTTTKAATTTKPTLPPPPPPPPAATRTMPANLAAAIQVSMPCAVAEGLRLSFASMFSVDQQSVTAVCVNGTVRVGTYNPGGFGTVTSDLAALNILGENQTFAVGLSERYIQNRAGEKLGPLPRNYGDYTMWWAFVNLVSPDIVQFEAEGEFYLPWYVPVPDHSADFHVRMREGLDTNAGRPYCWRTFDIDLYGANSAGEGYAEGRFQERIDSGDVVTPGCVIADLLGKDEARYVKPPFSGDNPSTLYELRYQTVTTVDSALVLGGVIGQANRPLTVNLSVPTSATAPLEGTVARAEVYVTGGAGGGVGATSLNWATPGGTLASGPRVIYDIADPHDGQTLTRQITLSATDSLGRKASATRSVTITVKRYEEPPPGPCVAVCDETGPTR